MNHPPSHAPFLPAAQLDEVRDRLGLDWRRFLALQLWYGSPSSASPAQAVQLYQQSVQSDASTPRPTPMYMDERASLGRLCPQDHLSPSASDLHHELLSLWTSGQQDSNGGGRALHQKEALASLLQASAYSDNPLDASLAWHVMTVLQAIGALPGGTASSEGVGDEVLGLTLTASLNLITQLRLVGNMSEWALYVALHLPDDWASWPGLRTSVVMELLVAHCPEWRADGEKLEFLRGQLGLNQVRGSVQLHSNMLCLSSDLLFYG